MARVYLFIFAAALGSVFTPFERASAQNKVQSLAAQTGVLTNTYTSAEDVAAGAKVFRAHCSTCHGRNAEGYRGPNLTLGRFRHGDTDGQLFLNILTGVPGTSMGGVYLPDRQIWQIISYVRSLAGSKNDVPVPGDAGRGKAVFFEKGDCSTCHRISGTGGRRGTDLTEIGWLRSAKHLRESILNPSESVATNFRLVQIVLKQGEDIDGLLLNEDTYSIQIMDQYENLVSILKRDVKEIVKPNMSLMPEYEGAFTNQELTDLIAYLYSLEGDTEDE